MRNTVSKLMVMSAISMGATLSSFGQGHADWSVRREALNCVVSNLDQYESRKTSAVIIDLQNCPPRADRVTSRLPRVSSTKNDVDNTIVYSKKQLGCLRSYLQTHPPSGNIVTLPDNLCQ